MSPTRCLHELPLPTDVPFTYAAALDAGVPRLLLGDLVMTGRLRRQLHGVYVDASAPDGVLLRAQALRLVVPDDYVVTDESAGWLAGAAMVLRPGSHLAVPPVTVFSRRTGHRLRNPLADSGERRLLDRDVHEVHGVLATTPLRTCLDLARLRPARLAIGAVDQLLRLGAFDVEEARAELGRFRGMRWVRQARELVPLGDARAESPPESALRLDMWRAGMPDPEPQLQVYDEAGRFLARADLGIPELKVLIEYDGEEFHDASQRRHDDARRAALVAEGWLVLVLRRRNVYGERRDCEELIWAVIAEARRTPHRRTGRVVRG